VAQFRQQGEDPVLHLIGHQGLEPVAAHVHHHLGILGRRGDDPDQGVQGPGVDDMVLRQLQIGRLERLVLEQGRVERVGVDARHRPPAVHQPLGEGRGQKALTDPALALQGHK
jgi:hypothetical protein